MPFGHKQLQSKELLTSWSAVVKLLPAVGCCCSVVPICCFAIARTVCSTWTRVPIACSETGCTSCKRMRAQRA
eukprot:4315153-Amphidinium_carterae.1